MYSTIREADINDNARDGGLNDEVINIEVIDITTILRRIFP